MDLEAQEKGKFDMDKEKKILGPLIMSNKVDGVDPSALVYQRPMRGPFGEPSRSFSRTGEIDHLSLIHELNRMNFTHLCKDRKVVFNEFTNL
ncbi:MAG: hypothetical protein U9R75_08105 [Candidatus Thermoplasmatota archaeon]|nr:hypothetical protein [Candidatus Thermoplasmatota archaeon]